MVSYNKIVDITDLSCKKVDENNRPAVYQLLLTDGITKELKNKIK